VTESEPLVVATEALYHIQTIPCTVMADCGLTGFHVHVRDQIFFSIEELESVWPSKSLQTGPSRNPKLPTFSSYVDEVGYIHVMLKDGDGWEASQVEVIVTDPATETWATLGGVDYCLRPNGNVTRETDRSGFIVIGYWGF
jgi:hypothetical protein